MGSILAYRQPYSFMVEPEAEDGVSTLSFFEAEKAFVEADDALLYAFIYSLPYAPSVARSLNYELVGYMVLVPEPIVGGFMEMSPILDAVKKVEGIANNFIPLLK
ncbi:MAG: hypothetical protein AOA65_0210 [Candidatus Bathyarchaeota archaeon BA1]|nr:MAG: hypothetical protein AOA65_0210 [Candidatus Bathyarchaeota archaeon BA1]